MPIRLVFDMYHHLQYASQLPSYALLHPQIDQACPYYVTKQDFKIYEKKKNDNKLNKHHKEREKNDKRQFCNDCQNIYRCTHIYEKEDSKKVTQWPNLRENMIVFERLTN